MPDNILGGLSATQLRKAATLREKIDDLEKQLVSILGAEAAPTTAAKPGRKPKSRMSAAARAKISAAQKKRWAKQKKAAKG
jgi:hypothetical protein